MHSFIILIGNERLDIDRKVSSNVLLFLSRTVSFRLISSKMFIEMMRSHWMSFFSIGKSTFLIANDYLFQSKQLSHNYERIEFLSFLYKIRIYSIVGIIFFSSFFFKDSFVADQLIRWNSKQKQRKTTDERLSSRLNSPRKSSLLLFLLFSSSKDWNMFWAEIEESQAVKKSRFYRWWIEFFHRLSNRISKRKQANKTDWKEIENDVCSPLISDRLDIRSNWWWISH